MYLLVQMHITRVLVFLQSASHAYTETHTHTHRDFTFKVFICQLHLSVVKVSLQDRGCFQYSNVLRGH